MKKGRLVFSQWLGWDGGMGERERKREMCGWEESRNVHFQGRQRRERKIERGMREREESERGRKREGIRSREDHREMRKKEMLKRSEGYQSEAAGDEEHGSASRLKWSGALWCKQERRGDLIEMIREREREIEGVCRGKRKEEEENT